MLARLIGEAIEDGSRQALGQEGTPEKNTPAASLHEFTDWLREAGEIEHISCAHLQTLYAEFAMFSDTPPLPDRQFFRGLRGAGIARRRQSTGARKWYYSVRRLGPSRSNAN